MMVGPRDESLADRTHSSDTQSSSMAASSGRRLYLALRCAGLAFSSGLACAIGCPGGAKGLRIESTIDALRLRRLAREDFIALGSERIPAARCYRCATRVSIGF